MDLGRYVNCIANDMSEGNLLLGDEKTALLDCGMMFCADDTIEKVKNALNGRPLDYIFASHTHYDHIGALPFFRAEWPGVQLLTSDIGAAALLKDTPRRVIRELSLEAAEIYRPSMAEYSSNYDDNAFHADIIVRDNDEIPLGGITVRIIEAPGHTRDTLCFYVPEMKLFFSSESIGSLLDGKFYTFYLTSYDSAVSSIRKCSGLPISHLSQAHCGILNLSDIPGYFKMAENAMRECRDFILSLRDNGLDEDAMVDAFVKKYMTPELLDIQPENAFIINTRAMIGCTLRDF